MSYTSPDFEKEYTVKNAEVTGFCKLTDLQKGQYGYNYQLQVLIDDKTAKPIEKDIKEALEILEADYGTTPKPFERITKTLKVVKNKETGKILERIPCPKGKTLLKLNMDAKEKDGMLSRIVHIFDSKNNPIKKITIGEGSIVNVKFKIRSYTNNSGNGLSLILMYVQILSLKTLEAISSESPFDTVDDGFDVSELETEYTSEEELSDKQEDEEEI